MIGIEIGVGLSFVTVSAFFQDEHPERNRIHPLDGMRGMAVYADR